MANVYYQQDFMSPQTLERITKTLTTEGNHTLDVIVDGKVVHANVVVCRGKATVFHGGFPLKKIIFPLSR